MSGLLRPSTPRGSQRLSKTLTRFLQDGLLEELMFARLISSIALVVATCGCAALGELRNLVQPPQFEQDASRRAEVRLLPPSTAQPLGGAGVRIWAHVSNPNPFGLTLGTLRGTLHIEDARAADVDFPLGLPLRASENTTIPIDLSLSLSDLPGLANVVRRAASREPLAYHLEGTIGVDAGQLGQPVFGPMTLLRGELRAVQ